MTEVDVVGMASAMVIALSGGMVVLWRNNQASLKDRIDHTAQQLVNCEKHHRDAMQIIVTLNKRVANLEGFAQRKHGDFVRKDNQ